ncbi:kinase-like domain-containing protein [Pisolithus thermaeus]|nr:kinase-like domain-containing protein [Pisolithus thermaeus]
MGYAEGGTLWDVLESSPLNGRISESDVLWWAPQAVCAIHWCHSQGFAHRDIKPHNFVLTSNYRLLLIDFGSAAPLNPPEPDGSQLIPQQYCLVPCGTCDYISPEILQAHEDALVALELSNQSSITAPRPQNTICGLETDWWSLGVMIYELAFGITPFFAKDIRTTYLRIVDHETSLKFDKTLAVSGSCRDLLQRLLTNREGRLGRRSVVEIMEHPFFANVDWSVVGKEAMPAGIHVPQFAYSMPSTGIPGPVSELPEDSQSHPFAFSALFQSSADHSSPGISALRSASRTRSSSGSIQSEAAFIGFSWGPSKDTFLLPSGSGRGGSSATLMTPRPLGSVQSKLSSGGLERVPSTHLNAFTTPIRPYNLSPYHTLPRPSTVRCTASRRAVSDREAMQQLVDCIGMSARKKVLASGRKPRILDSLSRNSASTIRKELRFGPPPIVPTKSFDSTDFPPVNASLDLDGSESGSEGPPSPSPSPRPGSAMSTLSRRSVTPTTTVSFSARLLNIPSASQSVISQDPSGVCPQVEWSDDAISLLEARHTTLLSQLGELQLRLDDLRATVER